MLFSPKGLSAQEPQWLSLQSSSAQEGLSARGASSAQFDELNYSDQAIQPKSRFSSGYSALKASAPKSLSGSVCKALELRKASAPKSRSSSVCRAFQFKKTSAPTEPYQLSLRAQLLCSGHAAQESVQLRLFSPKGLSAQEPQWLSLQSSSAQEGLSA